MPAPRDRAGCLRAAFSRAAGSQVDRVAFEELEGHRRRRRLEEPEVDLERGTRDCAWVVPVDRDGAPTLDDVELHPAVPLPRERRLRTPVVALPVVARDGREP